MDLDALEVWKDVEGTDGFYQVSNTGSVRSCYGTRGAWRELKQCPNSTGYMRVRLSYPEKKSVFVHRLVATAFVENPNGYSVVNHKDFNPLNCNADNLEWTTLKGNYEYSAKRGRFERTPEWRANQTEALRACMGKAVIGLPVGGGKPIFFETLNQCKERGFQPSCVSNCCNGKRKTTGGYTWAFAENLEAWK